jgi:hypothetical protein
MVNGTPRTAVTPAATTRAVRPAAPTPAGGPLALDARRLLRDAAAAVFIRIRDAAMTFKPAIWHPITVALSAVNLIGIGLAAGAGEPWHAGVHVALAGAFALAARHLRQTLTSREHQAELDEVALELRGLRQELSEALERLDFTERMLTQGLEPRRVEVERRDPGQPESS